jgi:hypothetical protein
MATRGASTRDTGPPSTRGVVAQSHPVCKKSLAFFEKSDAPVSLRDFDWQSIFWLV